MDSGSRLGHYEILEPLGVGGMGEVYRARDSVLGRDVAIKVLPADFAADSERLARFAREATLLAQLNHPNIATIYGLENDGGVRFIAMECVEGETLAERLAASGRLGVDEAITIARQIAEAMEAAHDSGIIHRDLKPANVKITPDYRVKVLDFGLAKVAAGAAGPASVSPDSLTTPAETRVGAILGTPAYMSPEQARGKPLDKRSDIWSYGCVLFELLVGQLPFSGETLSDTIGAILHVEPDWGQLPEGHASSGAAPATTLPCQGPADNGFTISPMRESSWRTRRTPRLTPHSPLSAPRAVYRMVVAALAVAVIVLDRGG